MTMSEFYTQYYRYVRSTVYRLSIPEADKQDIVQEVWLSLCRNFERIDPERSAIPYLHRAVVNKYYSYLRGLKCKVVSLEACKFEVETLFVINDVHALLERKDMGDKVKAKVQQYPNSVVSSVVDFIFYKDYSYKDTADILGLSIEKVRSAVVNFKQYCRRNPI
jgi:RNA polymerase sigma factor (sigma-70 family)